MSFSELLETIVEDCGGGIGIALMGDDGIAIEQVMARAPSVALDADDIGADGYAQDGGEVITLVKSLLVD